MSLNFIDKTVALFSPRAALGRVQAKMALASYDAAKPSRTHNF